MGSNFLKGGKELDPTNILNLQEYELVRNLYSRLVEYNKDGELIPGVADSFEWHGQDLVFTFGSKVQTIDGDIVSAEDAALSLKRAILLKKTGHGDLRNLLCPNKQLNSIHDDCPGISVEGNRLTLRPVKRELGVHLLTLLDSADFSIIPKRILSSDSKNPLIVSHRNTSGPFYVDKDADDGSWTLRANPHHYHYSANIPHTVQLVPTTSLNAAQLFTNREIDLIPTPIFFAGQEAERILNDRENVNVHESIPIKVLMACFTPSAVRRFSTDQRLFAASLIGKYLSTNFPVPGGRPTVEFFQALSDGALSTEQRVALKSARSDFKRLKFKDPIRMGTVAGSYDRIKAAFQDFPEVMVVKTEVSAYQLPLSERPDMYVVSSDSAWTESLSLLGHNFHIGIFHLPGVDGDKWMQSYVEIEDREERMKSLSVLHDTLLKKVVIYPIYVSPYYAIARKPWTVPFSTFSAGTELWRMNHEQ